MKKIFAYTLTAVVLGAGIMLFPIRDLFVTRSEEGHAYVHVRTLSQLGSSQEESSQKLRETYGLDAVKSQPTDPFMGVLVSSFLIALIFYLFFRRRRPDSSYRYYQSLLRP